MLFNSKPGLLLLLLMVFVVNLAETSWETSMHTGSPVSVAGNRGAYAVQQLEPEWINFEFHDQTANWAVYAYSLSYFMLFPMIALGVPIALARRAELAPFRVLCLAVTAAYLVSLPYFLLYPVPERWAYPDSNAILLSDRWSSALIDSVRPLSAINNSFPSFSVSLTVIVVCVCWLFHLRLRNTVTALGLSVMLATFTLGINWLASIIAGVLVGILSVGVAWRFAPRSI